MGHPSCGTCSNAYVDDLFYEWMCKKGHLTKTDEEGFISFSKIDCPDYEEENNGLEK